MKHAGSLFVVLITIWLLWSGHYTALLTGLGLFSCMIVLLAVRRMGVVDQETAPFELGPRLVLYLPWLIVQIVKSNIDVARLVLNPRLPIRPHLIRVRPGQHSNVGRVVYANSITLTPGTVTVGFSNDELTIHALTDDAAEGVLGDAMNRKVCLIEGRP